MGLSIINASAAKYKAKFNAVRKHLQDMPDHPLVKLIQFFRDTLLEFLQERQAAIQKSLQFFKHDVQDMVHTKSGKGNSAFAEQQKRLFQRVVQEVKGFVSLLHDAVIRFYMLDVKVGLQYN